MKKRFLTVGRLWQLEENIILPENIRQAIRYYEKAYGESFGAVRMRPALAEEIDADTCHGLKVIADPTVGPGLIYLTNGDEG